MQSNLHMKKSAACTFCAIVKADVERHIVFEDSATIAVLDIKPLFPGHTLLMPKAHCATLKDLPNETAATLFKNAKVLACSVEKAMKADGIFIAVNDKVSQSIPHFHIHIVPRRFGDGLKGFFRPRQRYSSKEEMARVQKSIADEVSRCNAASA